MTGTAKLNNIEMRYDKNVLTKHTLIVVFVVIRYSGKGTDTDT
jgi:hypothetical protein